MWYYKRIPTGYYRIKSKNDRDSFMFDILGNKVNRDIWKKLCQWTICKIFDHSPGKICIEKGYTKEIGTFELTLCDRCRAKVLFYEGARE